MMMMTTSRQKIGLLQATQVSEPADRAVRAIPATQFQLSAFHTHKLDQKQTQAHYDIGNQAIK